MTEPVDPKLIEQIVGRERHPDAHYARLVSVEDTIYILHSKACLAEHRDLRECRLSKALDRGTHAPWWTGLEDRAVPVVVWAGLLAPASVPEAHHG